MKTPHFFIFVLLLFLSCNVKHEPATQCFRLVSTEKIKFNSFVDCNKARFLVKCLKPYEDEYSSKYAIKFENN